MSENNIIIPELNSETIESMIYEIRGQRVMLDFELAKIYGYETRDFNNQVKNNIERFEKDFRFQLERDEWNDILWLKKSTANTISKRRYLPYAFTEQGIYMLMTVLKGELAVKQSKTIIRLFKQMKDYIIKSNNIISTNDLFKLISKVDSNTEDIKTMKNKINKIESNIVDETNLKHFLILDGQRLESIVAYQAIYRLAKKSIYIVDDYIDVKTLLLLKVCKQNIDIIIFTDNKAKNNINDIFINDFKRDTGLNITFKLNNNRFHDRYIVIDYNTSNEIIYHCGSSSKDGGKRITTIMRIDDLDAYKLLLNEFLEK
ncbi:MAG: ORF6N domain-containing protein [Acholeplasmatales bacterium]|nr:ORF6N domain-containing protein [Acholeplasmatales bacterium]